MAMVQNPGWHELSCGSSLRLHIFESLRRLSSWEKWPKTKASLVCPALSSFSLWSWEFPGLLRSSRAQGENLSVYVRSKCLREVGSWNQQLHPLVPRDMMGELECDEASAPKVSLPAGDSAKGGEALRKKCKPLFCTGSCLRVVNPQVSVSPFFPSRREQSWCPWISKACKYQHPNSRYVGGLGECGFGFGPCRVWFRWPWESPSTDKLC